MTTKKKIIEEVTLIPFNEIDDEVKDIAFNSPLKPNNAFISKSEVEKLASDITRYSQNQILIRTQQYSKEIDHLLKTEEGLKKELVEIKKEKSELESRVIQYEQWLAAQIIKTTGPGAKDGLLYAQKHLRMYLLK